MASIESSETFSANGIDTEFRHLADDAPVMLWVTDAGGRCIYLNQRWYEHTGQTPENAEGYGWLDASHPEDRERAEAIFLDANRRQAAFQLEYRLRSRDGSYRWAIDAARPRFGALGEFLGFVGSVVDIQERHQAEERLAFSEERLRLATDAAEIGLWDVDPRRDTLFWPPSIKLMFGISAEATVSMADYYAGLHPDDREPTLSAYAAACDPERRAMYDVEYRTIGKEDGVIRWVAARGRGVFDASGACVRVIGTALDITERKLTEAALVESEARYVALFEAIEAGFCVVEVDLDAAGGRVDYRVVEANPAFYAETGFPRDIFGQWLRDAAPSLEEHWFDTYGRVARTGEAESFEQGSDLLGRWFDVHAYRFSGGERPRVAILFNDISARRKAEARQRAMLQKMPGFVALLSGPDHVFDYVNDAYSQLVQGRKVIGRSAREVFPDLVDQGFNALLDEVYRSGQPFIARTFPIQFGDEAERFIDLIYEPIRDGGEVTGIFVGGYEITERVRAEAALQALAGELEQTVAERTSELTSALTALRLEIVERERAEAALRQSQKLESMGQLTGGVAHDFNNLLTPIIGSLDLLQRKAVGGPREQRLIGGAIQSAERARVLVQRLLAFARRQPLQPVPIDLGGLIAEMADLIGSTVGPQIKVIVDVEADLPPARGDENQIEMALLNLAVNARDAMREGGDLRISANLVQITSDHPSKLAPGSYLRLSVADTGVGMDETTLARAVEPFFSTKGIGQGTGLGLSMAHGLASQLGGALTISSKPGLGTNIDLWLPPTDPREQGDGPASLLNAAPRAHGLVLLVDDEDTVRMTTADMLSDLGFAVVEAGSAEDALQKIDQGLRPTWLVTDHLMPGMSGAELALRLKDVLGDVRVLIISGYADVDGVPAYLPRLTKPFKTSELSAALV